MARKMKTYLPTESSKDRKCELCGHVHTIPQMITLDGREVAVVACAICKHGAYQEKPKQN